MMNCKIDREQEEFSALTRIIHEYEREYLKRLGYHEPCFLKCKHCNDQCYPFEKAPNNVLNKRVGLSIAISKYLSQSKLDDMINILNGMNRK